MRLLEVFPSTRYLVVISASIAHQVFIVHGEVGVLLIVKLASSSLGVALGRDEMIQVVFTVLEFFLVNDWVVLLRALPLLLPSKLCVRIAM